MIWLFIAIGGFIGGMVPAILGVSDTTTVWSVFTATFGSILGIIFYKKLDY